MRILWVHAHPEPRSLTSSLRDEGIDAADRAGHEVELSDLYAMGWNATLDTTDFGDLPDRPTEISRASKAAYRAGTLPSDIRAEQDKLLWCDTVVLQFPLWWYSTPAILKGWIDRVFTKGFAYGIPDPANPRRTHRYGDGPLSGRRAQVFVTIGSPAPAMGPRGVNGQLDHVLFPLLHGTLWYVGMDVLPPVAIHDADHITSTGYDAAVRRIRQRVRALASVQPLPYRRQNGGDYDDDLVLRDHIEPGRSGVGVHLEGFAGALTPSGGPPQAATSNAHPPHVTSRIHHEEPGTTTANTVPARPNRPSDATSLSDHGPGPCASAPEGAARRN